jgi:hypothetical protein
VTKIPLIYLWVLITITGLPVCCPAADQIQQQGLIAALSHPTLENESGHRLTHEHRPRVEIRQHGTSFQIFRENKPYYIKGIGGRRYLETAVAAGANSIRTWDPRDAGELLDRAQGLRMTVMVGIWLSQHASDYADPYYKAGRIEEVRRLVEAYKDHPALLIWSLGNEINLLGGDTREAWLFIDQLALMIKELDPNHPVITVIAYRESTLNAISAYAPHLDAVGINAYGALAALRDMVDRSFYRGPYIVTEWGVDGHWEATLTSWGRPIEPTSARKEEFHLLRYDRDILANSDRCIGSYVFLWGWKQERTPTWYSMFLRENLEALTGPVSFAAVDAMHFNWSGTWPLNRAPEVRHMLINDVSAENNIVLPPGEPIISRVEASDPDNDTLSYIWELLEEPTALGVGGSYEARPRTLAGAKEDGAPEISLRAPDTPGQYRLFVYVLDNRGHAGTANIPFRVSVPQDDKIMADLQPLTPG